MKTQGSNRRFDRPANPLMRRATVLLLAACAATAGVRAQTTNWSIVGWNNLGMHCADADFSVFCILPPYNTFHAQVIDPSGLLATGTSGVTVTYAAVADPSGSINSTSYQKLNFWNYVQPLFGVALAPDVGLPIPGPAGYAMPGANNVPQSMSYASSAMWFEAYGVPITPIDDARHTNRYPMMRLTAHSGGAAVASVDIVLPVSAELNCRACHGSGSGSGAQPSDGWVNDPNQERDFRLNILRIHDDRQLGTPEYATALANGGFNAAGLYATVVSGGKPILCASCHLSEALPGTGQPGIPPLTESIHITHATVMDPANGMLLGASANRTACYYCHPGLNTKCLRGVMGNAVAADGSRAIECQSCHGGMANVGAPNRTGWLEEPNCQACHTGDAVNNAGAIRFTSVFTSSNTMRTVTNQRFATMPDVPATGYSLYRFSQGHGGLYCEACHNSTHAEFPSADTNDNIMTTQNQGHIGMLAECDSCHNTQPTTINGGPHGMHPVGQTWVSRHQNSGGGAQCQVCHGTDYRGTVLSRARSDRTLSAIGTKNFWRGFQIGCYTCHNGPGGSGTGPAPAVVTSRTATTTAGKSVGIPLTATGSGTLALRVVSQTSHGTVGLSGTAATYIPDPGFTGTDSFTFAAWNGTTDSNLGQVNVTVTASTGACTYVISPIAASATAGSGSGNIAVTAAAGCTWTASSSAPWITISSGTSGNGPGTVTYNYTANTGAVSRSGTLTVAGDAFPLTQAGVVAICTYAVAPTTASFGPGAGNGTVTVNTTAGCTWTASSGASWVTITSGASGSGPATVAYSVAANTGAASRSTTLTIAGQFVAITQAGISCAYTISPTTASLAAAGGNGTVTVTTTPGCAWTASSSASWVSIASGSSGSGSGSVTYSVAANTGTSTRSATLTIAGLTFTITQAGGACVYTISPTTAAFGPAATNGAIAVNTGASCAWTVTESISWITITSGSGGTGPGTVRYSVATNGGSARSGTMTIAGQTFSVSQAGAAAGCTYVITPLTYRFASNGGTGSVHVGTGHDCSWTAQSQASWITISSSGSEGGTRHTGSGSINYRVARNFNSSSRTGTMIIAGQTFTVYQSGARAEYGNMQESSFGQIALEAASARQRITAEFIMTNAGTEPSDAAQPAIFLSDDNKLDAADMLLWTRSINGLAPGESKVSKFRVSLPGTTTAHGKYLIAVTKSKGVITTASITPLVYGPID